MEGSPLEPHLRYPVGEGAWFNPITLVANLPESVKEATLDVDKMAIVHENIHYLQATTTYFGMYRYLKYWESITELAHYIGESKTGKLSKEQLEKLRENFERNQRQSNNERFGPFVLQNEIEFGPCYVEVEGENHPAYCKLAKDGKRKLYFYDAFTLQESMAMALERWYGYSENTYQLVVEQPELGFHYVVGTEAVKEITKWDEESCLILTVILSDIALNHPNQSEVFFHGIWAAKNKWEKFPGIDQLSEVYRFLFEKFELDEVQEFRNMIRSELEARLVNLMTSIDPLDNSISGLLTVMYDALVRRNKEPEIFARYLLVDMDDADLIHSFSMPSFMSQGQMMRINKDESLTNAPFFISTAYHFLKTTIYEETSKECPLYHLKTCNFKRTAACKNRPWKRKIDDPKSVCVYRFVHDAFFNAV